MLQDSPTLASNWAYKQAAQAAKYSSQTPLNKCIHNSSHTDVNHKLPFKGTKFRTEDADTTQHHSTEHAITWSTTHPPVGSPLLAPPAAHPLTAGITAAVVSLPAIINTAALQACPQVRLPGGLRQALLRGQAAEVC
jgi:hypothetical protein